MSPARRKTRKSPIGNGHRTRVGLQRRERTRAKIVAAAMQVFAEKGADAPVIDDFIRSAGVARGTFYNYFTRTEQLLTAVSRQLEDERIRAIDTAMTGIEDPVVRVATGVRLWLSWAQADPTGCGFVVRSRFRGPLVEKILQADLRAGAKAGSFEFASVAIGRDLVIGTILEAMHRMLVQRVPRSFVDSVAESILRGLGVGGPQRRQVLGTPLQPESRLSRTSGIKAPSIRA